MMVVRGWYITEPWRRTEAWYERQEKVDYIKRCIADLLEEAGRPEISERG